MPGAIVGSGAASAQFYVDSVNGNDANSGTTAAKAKRTIAGLIAGAPMVVGNAINLAKGSTWRERLTVPVNSITVQAYGSGNDPVLDCSDAIASNAWTKTANRTNVYEVPVAVEGTYNAGAANRAGVWCNGVRLVVVADLATCDSTAGSVFPSSIASNTPTYYVHAPGSTDPRSDGKTYEYAARSTAIDTFSRTGCVIRGIATKRPYQSYGSITLGVNCQAIDCRASEGNRHNVFLRAGASCIRVTADEAYDAGLVTLFVYYESVANGENLTYTDCVARMTTASPGGSLGYYGHAGSGDFGTATYTRCTAPGCDNAYSSGNTTSVVWQ